MTLSPVADWPAVATRIEGVQSERARVLAVLDVLLHHAQRDAAATAAYRTVYAYVADPEADPADLAPGWSADLAADLAADLVTGNAPTVTTRSEGPR